MSGEIGFLVLLPVAAAGAVVVGAGAAAAGVGYGVVVGARKIMELERARSARKDHTRRIEQIKKQAFAQFDREVSSIKARQQQFGKNINNMKSMLGDVESEIQKKIITQQNALSEQIKRQQDEYNILLSDQASQIRAQLEEEKQIRKEEIRSLQLRVQEFIDTSSRKQELSHVFINDLELILNDIDKLPHVRFEPGVMDKIRRQFISAKQSLSADMPESALMQGQQVYREAIELRQRTLVKEQQFVFQQTLLQQAMDETLEEITTNSILILDLSDEEEHIEFELDINHWTYDELRNLKSRVEKLQQQLDQEIKGLTVDDLQLRIENIEALKSKIPEIVKRAKENLIASQARANIASLAADALDEQGFEPVEATYEEDDERSAYTVKLRNIAGSEVVAVIAPVEGDPGKNSVVINNYDETFVDESVMQQRASEIAGILHEKGLEVSKPKCLGNANPAYRDLTQIRQKKTKPNVRVNRQ